MTRYQTDLFVYQHNLQYWQHFHQIMPILFTLLSYRAVLALDILCSSPAFELMTGCLTQDAFALISARPEEMDGWQNNEVFSLKSHRQVERNKEADRTSAAASRLLTEKSFCVSFDSRNADLYPSSGIRIRTRILEAASETELRDRLRSHYGQILQPCLARGYRTTAGGHRRLLHRSPESRV